MEVSPSNRFWMLHSHAALWRTPLTYALRLEELIINDPTFSPNYRTCFLLDIQIPVAYSTEPAKCEFHNLTWPFFQALEVEIEWHLRWWKTRNQCCAQKRDYSIWPVTCTSWVICTVRSCRGISRRIGGILFAHYKAGKWVHDYIIFEAKLFLHKLLWAKYVRIT